MISLIKNKKLFFRVFLKFAIIIIFVFNDLGAIRIVYSRYYGSGDTDAHYDVLSKNDGNGGVTIQVTTVGSGDGTTESYGSSAALAGVNNPVITGTENLAVKQVTMGNKTYFALYD